MEVTSRKFHDRTRLPGDHLLHQVVGNLNIAAGQARHLALDVGCVAQREACQAQAGDPAFDVLVEQGHRGRAERRCQ